MVINRLDKAIEDLKKEYETAEKLSFVNDPLAYALYQVWKKYDEKDKQQARKSSDKR